MFFVFVLLALTVASAQQPALCQPNAYQTCDPAVGW